MFSEETISVYPERDSYSSSGIARCFMFYDWEEPIGPGWLNIASEIFAEFGQNMFESTCNLGEKHSRGSFSRVQRKLIHFVEEIQKNPAANFDMRLRSKPFLEEDAFFPCEIEIVLGMHKSGRKEGSVAVRDTLVDSCASLIERISKRLFSMTGAVYATGFDFPTRFGPASYLASIGAIPKGGSSLVNKEYMLRMSRWRDNRWKGLLTNMGYLREIYPINYVLDAHLNMVFKDRPLSEYMKRVGGLRISEYNEKNYCWSVPVERLDKVRQELESSGLILSADYPPIRLN